MPVGNGTDGGIISGMTTFLRPGTSTTQVVLNFGGAQYQSGLEGQARHLLNMNASCSAANAAVTPDGKWIACVSTSGPSGLQVAALHAAGTAQVHHVSLQPHASYDRPTWSPNEQYLAVLLHAVSPLCSVAIYASPPPHTAFTWAVQLTTSPPQFIDCGSSDIVWSADGQRLVVVGGELNPVILTVVVAPLLQAFARTSPAHVISQDFSQAIAAGKALPSNSRWLFVNPAGDTVLSLSWGFPVQFISDNLHTHQSSLLFTLPQEYLVDAVSWLPNGRQFLLAVSGPQCVDCGSTILSDVYLYTL
jgi:hypothetical protein